MSEEEASCLSDSDAGGSWRPVPRRAILPGAANDTSGAAGRQWELVLAVVQWEIPILLLLLLVLLILFLIVILLVLLLALRDRRLENEHEQEND